MNTDGSGRIVLVPIGGLKTWFLPRLRHALREAFEREVASEPPIPMPSSAWHSDRRQSAASVLLDALAARRDSSTDRVLGVTDVDLFVPGLHYVFGTAEHRRGVAVCSTRRLAMGQQVATFLDGAAAEAVHLMGCLHGLEYCAEPLCAMAASDSITDMTRKGHRFCPAHAAQLHAAMRDAPAQTKLA